MAGSGETRGCEHGHEGGGVGEGWSHRGEDAGPSHLLHEVWMLVVPPSAQAVIPHHQEPPALQGQPVCKALLATLAVVPRFLTEPGAPKVAGCEARLCPEIGQLVQQGQRAPACP